ncbi:probable DNA double-strand break repair Rad50 ATPase [Branchiostoma lanceolatum]|uniref:probable DNA double-strand break repair Rad50 ATPase n=1 Tax=Branchiostoma lanceolatum TaxID=7740 RepID=UPI0034548BF3
MDDLIRNNYVLLRERLQVEKLIPHFIERRLLDFPDKQVVMSKTTTPAKAEALLEFLTKKGTCKPEEFLEILKKGDHQHVADQLKITSSQKETTEGAFSARLGDNSTGTQGSEGFNGSSSDEESLQENYRLLIDDTIFDEEVLNDSEKFERRLSYFRQHVDSALHYFKLSWKAKLRIRVKKRAKRLASKVHRKLFSERNLGSSYDKMVECFALFSATLQKIEDGCVLCTLEFDDISDLKSFLRGYRDGKLSETLTQELITEEMKQEEGPDLYVHVTLLVAKGSVGAGDEGSEPEETDHMPEDKEVQKTIPGLRPDSTTPGLKKSISRSLDDIHAMQLQIHPVQKGTPQPDLSSLDLATTFVQDSRVKDWACDSLTNHLALRLSVKSRQLQEAQRKVKSTIELHNNKIEEQASVMLRLSDVVRELTHKLETAEKILSDKNSEIQQQREAIKNLTAINEDLQAQSTKLAANVEGKETREQASVMILSDKNSEIQQQKEATKNLTTVIEDLQAENTKLAAKVEDKETKEHDLEVVPSSAGVSGGGQSGSTGMEERHKKILKRKYKDLTRDLRPDDIMDHLIQEDVFDFNDIELVRAQKVNKLQVEKLLSILMTRGPRAFGVFLESLEERYLWLHKDLKKADEESARQPQQLIPKQDKKTSTSDAGHTEQKRKTGRLKVPPDEIDSKRVTEKQPSWLED